MRLEQAKRDFEAWEKEQNQSDIMYSKFAHEVIAWILYEQIGDMVSSGADQAEIAEFSSAWIAYADERIKE